MSHDPTPKPTPEERAARLRGLLRDDPYYAPAAEAQLAALYRAHDAMKEALYAYLNCSECNGCDRCHPRFAAALSLAAEVR